tara:strand:- start:289 stop:672 length:384 start_codon:yes stop_codon:yes gene_type:complete
MNRGVIRNREYAQQIRDFSGLQFGSITPTDIDGFVEFGDKVFVFIEGKHGGASMPHGQRLALERLCDTVASTGRKAFVILISHNTDGDINYADCPVSKYRFDGKWAIPAEPITLRAIMDNIRARYVD